MEAILIGIYAFFVWLIFIKLKWLPWNIMTQVIVAIIPIVGLTVLILLLNVYAPSSSDVRVFKYTVPIVSQVRGRVIEVPVEEGNRPVKKGDVLFKIDPTPYQLTVNQLAAQLADAKAQQRALDESLKQAKGKVVESSKGIDQAAARGREVQARLQLATLRVQQNRELASTGAGSKFDLEKSEADLKELQAQLDSARDVEAQARAAEVQARSSQEQVQHKLSAQVDGGEQAQVATVRAQLENARWELEQTVVRSPCDCYVINLQLRPGAFVAGMPLNAVMTLVEVEGHVVALFYQNELHQIRPGDEAEFSLQTNPGKIVKAKVDSVIWATGAGQMPASGTIPMTGVLAAPANRFAVKFDVEDKDRALFLAPGAAGQAAIYTQHFEAIQILRKVILRVGAKLNYLILKLH
jgi:multidrug resistance efflux pump